MRSVNRNETEERVARGRRERRRDRKEREQREIEQIGRRRGKLREIEGEEFTWRKGGFPSERDSG